MTNYYATCRGTIATASLKEIFVHSFAIVSTASASTVANSLSTLWQACLNTGAGPLPLKDFFPSWVAYNEVTVAEILNMEPPDPRLAAAVHVTFTPIPGGAAGGGIPSQNAVAVSIKAGTKPNGTPAKGRFYLPTPSASQLDGSTGLLAAGKEVQVRDTIASWWQAMNAAGHKPALWSRSRGTIALWDAVRVGRTVDTIRRRRNELPETYSQYVTVP